MLNVVLLKIDLVNKVLTKIRPLSTDWAVLILALTNLILYLKYTY